MNELFQLVLKSGQTDGLEECNYSKIPSYKDYLAQEIMGYFGDKSFPSESIGGFSGLVASENMMPHIQKHNDTTNRTKIVKNILCTL
jgi:hypothetical protein